MRLTWDRDLLMITLLEIFIECRDDRLEREDESSLSINVSYKVLPLVHIYLSATELP